MRVAFDASTAAFQKKTGTGVYCEEFIKAYQERFPEDHVIHTYRLSRALRGWEYLLPIPANASREVLIDPWTFFRGTRYEIFHGLNSRLPLLARSKMIATIHDLFSIFGEFSEDKFKVDQTRKLMQMVGRADHIIVPAAFTKEQLENKLNVRKEKITVIGEGVREIYRKPFSKEESFKIIQNKFNIKNPFVLFVGTLEKRKNIVGCVRAFARFRKTSKQPLDLVLAGNPGFQFEEIEREINSSGVKEHISILGFVEEENLAQLYRACEAFLFLSWEEGYGIPLIEAMACGAPIISSNTTSLPEVGAGNTWLVSPSNDEEISITLGGILKKTSSIIEKIKKAQVYAQGLTWTKVAENTRDIYTKILGI